MTTQVERTWSGGGVTGGVRGGVTPELLVLIGWVLWKIGCNDMTDFSEISSHCVFVCLCLCVRWCVCTCVLFVYQEVYYILAYHIIYVLCTYVISGCFALSCPKNFRAQSDPVLFCASDNKRLELCTSVSMCVLVCVPVLVSVCVCTCVLGGVRWLSG